jgi:demethylmenaquinone methyltransferase / 2-methoxy-6-polyprenyl-1,4-benzoquinol methylase
VPEPDEHPGALLPPDEVRQMFDRIVRRYDLMNRLMTGGRDVAWRRKAAEIAIGSGATRAIDIATGTGDLALELRRQGVPSVVGLDFAGQMLLSARRKIDEQRAGGIDLVRADAMRLPFPDGCFDAATIAWGLRNLPDYECGIAEMARVLAPEGRLVILEMTPLRHPTLRRAFHLYFDRMVPVVGGVISGDPEAYRYLPASVGAFPDADALADLMRGAGLRNVRYLLLAAGTVGIHVGIRR